MATPPDPTVQNPPAGPGPAADPASGAAATSAQAPAPDPAQAVSAAPSGPLAQIFAPIQPARVPVTPIGTTATLTVATDTTDKSGSGSGSGKDDDQDGPLAAFMRALAARIGRTGTTTHIKRNHTVTENRVSGNQVTTANTNKSDRTAKNENSAQHRSNRDAKVADLNNKASQTQARSNRDVKKADATDAKTSDAKSAKADTSSKTSKDSRDSRDAKTSNAKASKNDTSAKSSTDDKNHDVKSAKTSDTKGPDGSSGSAKTPKPSGPDKPDAAKAGSTKTSDEPKTLKPDGKATADTTKTAGKEGEGKVDLAKAGGGKPDNGTEPGTPGSPGPGGPNKPDADTAQATQKPRTQSSREAGYRDGGRAAAAVGHVKAWRDGTRDGYDDRKAADEAERKRMDNAKAQNAAGPKTSPGPQMAPASGSTADLAQQDAATVVASAISAAQAIPPATPPATATTTTPTPQPTATATGNAAAVPAQVTAVGEKAVQFTADGAAHTMSRGEVRTLKQFERRLGAKQQNLARIAEGSKTTRAKAAEHATQAQRLAEQARGVKGGATLVSLLLRLAERAQALRGKAEEIEKNAHRGTEAVKVLAANAETRHGGIYKAVVDSPLTSPAEREFYQDKQGS